MERLQVKEEPSVDFALILPREIVNFDNVKPKSEPGTQPIARLRKFDKRWKRMAMMFKEYKFCYGCNYVTNHRTDLKRHFLNCAKNPCQYKCDLCTFSVGTMSSLRRHIKWHVKKVVCTICKNNFPTKTELSKHLRSKREDAQSGNKLSCYQQVRTNNDFHANEIRCENCSKLYFTIHQYSMHKYYCERQKFPCTCGKKFSKYVLLSHQKRNFHGEYAHKKAIRFPCDKCDKSFALRQDLRRHQLNKHVSVEKLTCQICFKVYTSRGSLMKHMTWMHIPIVNRFECVQQYVKEKQKFANI